MPRGGKYLYLDIETHGADEMWDMPPEEFFRLGQYAWDDGEVVLTESRQEMIEQIEKARYIVGHNIISFDLTALYGKDSIRPLELVQQRRVIDTMVLAHLLTPAPYSYTDRNGHTFYDAAKPERAMRYYSLDNLAYQFHLQGKFGDIKELARKYNPPKTPSRSLDFGLIPLDDPDFLEYSRQDIIAVRDLYKHLMFVQSRVRYSEYYTWRELELAGIMAQISRNGILVDQNLAQHRIQEQQDRQREIMRWLVDEFNFPTTGKQPWKSAAGKEAILRALESYGIFFGAANTDWPATPTGAPSFSGDTLVAITAGTEAEALGSALAELQGQRSMAQLALDSTHSDGRAHPNVTAFQRSGRWSFTNPGVTIWDVNNKDLFLADPGHVCVEFDFSNADARAVAALSGDLEYARRFEVDANGDAKYDGHNLTGEVMFGDDYYKLLDEHGKPALRPLAKMGGHAQNYNIGSKKLAATLTAQSAKLGLNRTFTPADAQLLIDNFNRTYWLVKRWKDRAVAEGESGFVTNTWGRRMVVDKDRSYTQSPALYGQSTTREVMGDALIKISRLGPAWARRMRAVIHDALVIDLPEATAAQDAETVKACMEQVVCPDGGIPIHFPAGVGPLDAHNWKEGAH